jgi:hypothetical protein
MLSPEQKKEFEELIQRYKAAERYEKTKYMNDTLEGKEWAEKTLIKIVKRLGELWDIATENERQLYMKKFNLKEV